MINYIYFMNTMNKIHIYMYDTVDLRRTLKRNKQFKIYNSKFIVFSGMYLLL